MAMAVAVVLFNLTFLLTYHIISDLSVTIEFGDGASRSELRTSLRGASPSPPHGARFRVREVALETPLTKRSAAFPESRFCLSIASLIIRVWGDIRFGSLSYGVSLYQRFTFQDLPGAEFLWCPLALNIFTPYDKQLDQRLGKQSTYSSRERVTVREEPARKKERPSDQSAVRATVSFQNFMFVFAA